MKRFLIIITLISLNYLSLMAQNEFMYGLNNLGGEFEGGNLYRVKPDGIDMQVLYQFDYNSVTRPHGKLIQDQNGFIYGISEDGGKSNRGTLYRYNPINNEIIVLYHFTSDSIGTEPKDLLFLTKSNKIIGQCNSNLEVFEFNLSQNSMRIIPQIQNSFRSRIIHSIFELKGRVFVSSSDHRGVCDVIEYIEANGSTSLLSSSNTFVYNKPIPLNDSSYIGTAHVASESGNLERSLFYTFNLSSNTLILSNILNPNIHGYRINANIFFIGPNQIITSCQEGGIYHGGTLISYNLQTQIADTIHSFKFQIGSIPRELIQADSNIIIGTCFSGGNNTDGTIFKYNIATQQTSLVFDITDTPYGKHPNTSILKTDTNTLFFNTFYGGNHQNGTLLRYQIIEDSLSVAVNYSSSQKGAFPVSNLIQMGNKIIGSANQKAKLFSYNLNTGDYEPTLQNGLGFQRLIKIDSTSFIAYVKGFIGPTYLFRFDQNLVQTYTSQMFDNFSEIHPIGEWLVHSNKKLYACGNYDGRNGQGTLFQFDPIDNSLQILYHFTDSNLIGINPLGGLAESQNGNLIGLASNLIETSIFTFDLNTNQISKTSSIPPIYDVNQRFGFELFQDSLLFGLASDSNKTKLFKYNLKTNQFNYISSGTKVGGISNFIKPIIGNDSNLYYSLYTAGSDDKGEIYKYEIEKDSLYRIIDFNNTSHFSGKRPLELLFLKPFTISIQEHKIDIEPQLAIFPNPLAESFKIESDQIIKSIRIFDIKGRLIMELDQLNRKSILIPFNHIKGTYIIELESNQRVYRKKLIKQ